MVPTFTSRPIDGGGAQLFPCSLRHGYAAGLRRGLRPGRTSTRPKTATGYSGDRSTAARPRSTRFRTGCTLEGVPPLVQIALHRPVLLAGPESSGGTDPFRRCRGCSHLGLRLQAQAASSFTGLLRQPGGEPFQPTRSHGASWRTNPAYNMAGASRCWLLLTTQPCHR
jgi:hypothetical protein